MANFYSSTEILNKVYSGTTLNGFSSDTEILNAVYDSTHDALRISGSGGSGGTYDDSSISTAISAEVVNRVSGDRSLSTAILNITGGTTDTSSLSTAVESISTAISGLTEEVVLDMAVLIGEGKVLGVVSGELSGVTVVVDQSSLSTALSTESSTRVSDDQSLSTSIGGSYTSISTEVSDRIVADQSIMNTLSGVTEVAIESLLGDGQLLMMTGTTLTGVTNIMPNLSTSILNLTNKPITGITTTTILDNTYIGKIVEANGSFTITLPSGNTFAGQSIDIINVGNGVITIAAEDTLQSDGNKLATQYTGASCYYRGGGYWIAVGKLTT